MNNLLAAAPILHCTFNVLKRGRGWVRVFVLDSRGCQIGYVNYHDGEVYNVHSYKKCWWDAPIDETDRIFCCISHWMRTGEELNIEPVIAEVIEECAREKQATIDARALLPFKKRKPVQGPDPRRRLLARYRAL